MTGYRYRVKFEPDPTARWRDIVIGADRTLEEFQKEINDTFGLDQGHLWFFGEAERYWNSSIRYEPGDGSDGRVVDEILGMGDRIRDPGETTMAAMAEQLQLAERDRICYLYDYGDEWRFYGILKEITEAVPDDRAPSVVGSKGEAIDQYAPTGPREQTSTTGSSIPEPLDTLLRDPIISAKKARSMESLDGVDHVLVLLSVETTGGSVAERLAVKLEDSALLLEVYPGGWEVVERIDPDGDADDELLEALVNRCRRYHAEIAELSAALTDRSFDAEAVDGMNVELEAELDRIGYSDV